MGIGYGEDGGGFLFWGPLLLVKPLALMKAWRSWICCSRSWIRSLAMSKGSGPSSDGGDGARQILGIFEGALWVFEELEWMRL